MRKSFLEAAKAGNSNSIIEMLGEYPELISIRMNDYLRLDSRKYYFRCPTAYGFTALHFAAFNRDLETAHILLDHGASRNSRAIPNLSDDGFGEDSLYGDGWSPLHIAAAHGHREMIELLLEPRASGGIPKEKAIIDIKDNYGATPLHLAVFNERVETVKLLISRGASLNEKASPNKKDKNGTTPLDAAWARSYYEIAEMLRQAGGQGGSLAQPDIFEASKSGFTKRVSEIVGADSESAVRENEEGDTPIHLACYGGHRDVVAFLLDNGADVNARRATSGFTPLHCASSKGHDELAAYLLDRGADVNCKAVYQGWTPLHTAAYEGHVEVVEVLLARSAEVDALAFGRATPLHAAAANGKTRVAEVLIKHKANVNAKDSCGSGNTPLSLAKQKGHEETVLLLKRSGAH